MSRSHAAGILAVLVAGATLVGAQSRGSEFSLYATIVDGTGAPAAALTPDDLQVTEAGAVAAIARVDRLDWPLSVQLLVDNGSGLEPSNIVHLRNGVRGLFEALPAGASVTFVTTAPQPRFLVRDSASPPELFDSIGRLAPDDGAGHLLDALNEATARSEEFGAERFSEIVALATVVGDANARDRDLTRVLNRMDALPITAHVVQYSGGSRRTATGGANQTQIGLAVTEHTGGRYEAISAATRLATLLPEIGAQIAKSYLDGRVRMTVVRPARADGAPRDVRLATRRGLTASGVSFDARLP